MRVAISLFALFAGTAFGLPALLADDANRKQEVLDEAKQLEGKWKVVAIEDDGRKAPEEEIKGMCCTIKDLEMQMRDAADAPVEKATLKLDLTKTPRHIDLTVSEGPEKGRTIKGIFKFEKERLVICIRGPEAGDKGRPKEFKTEAGSGLGIITLERAKD
jgi:uncharacterized protein (TIGR03067 family)